MACLIGLGQLLLLVSILFLHTTALPVLESQEDMERLMRRKTDQLNSLVARNLDDRPSLSGDSRLQARQLADIHFSNNYAEYLRSKAKLSFICYLRQMQHRKKSTLGGEAEDANQLLKSHICPTGYLWNADL